jgi:hypothetical protein
MRLRGAMFLAAVVLAVELCGAASARAPSPPGPKAPIVGRWEMLQTCPHLIQATKKADLLPVAPMLVGEYFPGKTPQQIARKRHLCRGAKPRTHSHFFTKDGLFGSLDQNEQQVDEDPWSVVDNRTIRIGRTAFHYQVGDNTPGGKVLALKPVITRQMRRKALAHPFSFTDAAWAVSVAYAGYTWNAAPCKGWC